MVENILLSNEYGYFKEIEAVKELHFLDSRQSRINNLQVKSCRF
jgi:hypothetical protein